MPGWNLREGILTELKVSDDEFWSLFRKRVLKIAVLGIEIININRHK